MPKTKEIQGVPATRRESTASKLHAVLPSSASVNKCFQLRKQKFPEFFFCTGIIVRLLISDHVSGILPSAHPRGEFETFLT